jgi:excisionase family DNA binding protein
VPGYSTVYRDRHYFSRPQVVPLRATVAAALTQKVVCYDHHRNHLLGALKVAEMLGLSRSNVQAMAQAGTIPAYKLAKQHKFAKDQVEQWIETQKITPEGEGK